MLASLVLSAALGSANFAIDQEFTTAPNSQNPTTLFLSGPFAGGDASFGFFAGEPQDWSGVDTISLRVALDGANPGVFFEVTLLDADYEPIGTYEGSTTFVDNTFKLIQLQLTEVGPGDPTRLSGLEFIWNGPADAGGGLALQSLVGSAGPVIPAITSIDYGLGGFTMTWAGTGDLPVSIERRESLQAGDWVEVAQEITSGTYTDANPPTGKAFYRVVVP